MSAAAAANVVTGDDIQLYLNQSMESFQEACRKGFTEQKFDAATAGLARCPASSGSVG